MPNKRALEDLMVRHVEYSERLEPNHVNKIHHLRLCTEAVAETARLFPFTPHASLNVLVRGGLRKFAHVRHTNTHGPAPSALYKIAACVASSRRGLTNVKSRQ